MVTLEQVTNLIQFEKKRLHNQKEKLKDITTLASDYVVLADYTNSVMENKLKEVKAQIEPLVNSAFKSIFKEDNLKFELHTDIKRGKNVYRVNIVDVDNNNEGLAESFGGAVIVSASVLLRMIFLMLTDRPRFIILDETLNPISPKYRTKTSEFFSELCNKLEFDILAVTFDENNLFSSSADSIIEAYKHTKHTTKFRQVK